jgi:cobyrinic acid a,c-diamide synthase
VTTIPRLCLTSVRSTDEATALAVGVARAAVARGLEVCALAVTTDRDVPDPEGLRRLSQTTGRAVHRLDPQLMSAPSLQRVVARAAEGCDLTLVVSAAVVAADATLAAARFVDAQAALAAPVALCVDVAEHERTARAVGDSLHAARRFTDAHDVAPHVALLWGTPIRERIDEEHHDVLTLVRETTARGATVGVPDVTLRELLRIARGAPALPPPVVHARRGMRARVGLVLDDCFDLYDEESLVQFEVAGAELVPISALDGGEIGAVDGLIVGDGRVERYSAALAARRTTRRALRELVSGGAPTLASGGGFAYLTRGLRTLAGALHPLVGAIDAEAVALEARLPRGHVEVETTVETVVGPAGARIRGYLQRGWLVRDLAEDARGVYATLSGPPDEGCGAQNLLATHFRPYWPSCPTAARAFVDRCARVAAARERDARSGSAG